MKALTYIEHGKFVLTLREAFPEGKEKDRPSQTADLGRAESRHQKARKQQCLQPKQSPELEA